jgi:regulatory protein YycI of two-component signal transduction system YycFG
MDWKRIKTIFILTFLLLDIFLVYQLSNEIKENEYKPLVSESDEEILKSLKYDTKIPKIDEKLTLISAKNISFSKESFTDMKDKLTIQETVGSSIHATLKNPYPITRSSDDIEDQLNSFLDEYVFYGYEYSLWDISKDDQTIVFNQYFSERPIFFDYSKIDTIPNGILELELNDKDQITGYKQTYLLISNQGDAQKIIPAEEALIKLFNYGYVKHDSVVEDIDLGYFSLISIENIQVFSPTWHIQISGLSYMVNAIDGTVTEYTEAE